MCKVGEALERLRRINSDSPMGIHTANDIRTAVRALDEIGEVFGTAENHVDFVRSACNELDRLRANGRLEGGM